MRLTVKDPSARMMAFRTLLNALVCSVYCMSPRGLRMNEWYPCERTSNTSNGRAHAQSVSTHFECAKVAVPLCHEGLCGHGGTVEKKSIEIFVKRIRAKRNSSNTSTLLWLVQGGPGLSSATCNPPRTV